MNQHETTAGGVPHLLAEIVQQKEIYSGAYGIGRAEQLELAVADRTRDLRLMMEELRCATESAEAAHRAKTIFLGNINHELRTPMNGILGMTYLAKQRVADPAVLAKLDVVEQSARALLRIIDDLIQIADIEAVRVEPVETCFTLAAICNRVAEALQNEAVHKGLLFEIKIHGNLGSRPLRGDAERLTSVLTKLGENAIKFTQAGFVTVRMEAVEESPIDLELRVEVQDSGIGIAVADQRWLFNLFEQVDGSSTRQYCGMGLGLAISKRLVESMGGTIGLRSDIGRGSTFWFVVRLRTE